MGANTQFQLMRDIISKATEPGQGGLDEWATLIYEANDGISLAARDRLHERLAVGWEVVTRGVWRIGGGQQMDRPAGITEEVAAQLGRALSDMDADMLTPAAASQVIQVGLYREVRYP